MAGEWNQATLGKVVDLQSGGTPSKSKSEYWGGSVPWVSAKDMKRFRLRDTEDHLTAEGAANGTRLVAAGTVLMLVRGMTLLNDLRVCIIERAMTFNQDVKALRPKTNIFAGYLPYLILGNRNKLLSLVDLAGHGTGRLNSQELKALDIQLPPFREQRAIAHVLSALDDKIELNWRMNETLEAKARALFTSWFVDFNPVRAKMEGCDTGLPRHLAGLFPDRLFESELGQIPRGWKVTTLGEIAEVTSGKRPELRIHTASSGAKIPVWGSNGPIAFTSEALINEPALITGRVGTLGSVFRATSPCWPSDNTLIVKPFHTQGLELLFLQMRRIDFESLNRGSTQPLLTQTDLRATRFVFPSIDVLRRFGPILTALYARVDASEEENRRLAAVRDVLLPKLISGELRVKEAEKFIRRVV